MKINDFFDRHGGISTHPIHQLAERWDRNAHVDRLLGTSVGAGVTLGDLLIGDGLRDQISPELLNAFRSRMGENAESYDQVRRILLDRLEDDPQSVLGMINMIKGQIGENRFVDEAQRLGLDARLADSPNQEAWDVAIDRADGATQYVQVKMHQDPDGIVSHIRDVQSKLQSPGQITDGGSPVESIDFAIPQETADHVRRRLQELDIDGVTLIPMQTSAREGAEVAQAGFDHVGPAALEHLFGQLLGATVAAASLHGMVQGFLLYKGSKDVSAFLSDTAMQTGLTTSGIAMGMGVETLLSKIAFVGGVPTFVLVFSSSIATRAVLQRMVDRKSYLEWLNQQNARLRERLAQTRLVPASEH